MAGFLDYLKKKGSISNDAQLMGVSRNKPMSEMQIPSRPTTGSAIPGKLEGVGVPYSYRAADNEAAKVSLADVQQDEDPYTPRTLEELLATQNFTPSTPEETEEERKKRERRDTLRVGWAGFLDGLNALSNLYYTTKWAPNQKVGSAALTPVMADIKEREKLRRAQDIERRKELKAHEESINKIRANWLTESAKYKADQAKAERTHKNRLAEIEARGDANSYLEGLRHGNRMLYGQQQNEAMMDRTLVRESNINQRADNRGSGGSGTSSKRSITLSDGKSYDYSKVREGALESVFNKMKGAISDKSELWKVDNLKTTQQKLSWLNENAYKYPELDGEIREALGIEGGKKKKPNPMGEETRKKPNPMN